MILNTGKCHYMCIGKDVGEMITSKEVEILGIKIDRKLSSHQHIKSISKKTGQKLSALSRIYPYLKDKKKRKLFII